MKLAKKTIRLFIILFISLLFSTKVYAAELKKVDTISIFSSNVINRKHSLLVDKRLLASSSYDLRTAIDSMSVYNQGMSQACWAFASKTVLETNLALKEGVQYNFSARHMTYSTAKTFTDGTNENGHNREAAGGGNPLIAMAYYTSGRGPILEDDMPFSEYEFRIPLSQIQNKTVQKQVKDYITFPSIIKSTDEEENLIYRNGTNSDSKIFTKDEALQIRNQIKDHIINYGAVTGMTLAGSEYKDYYNYNLEYPAFYCDKANEEVNHQVTIIGWDDNYSVNNFNPLHKPKDKGAYLILNSYGKNEKFQHGCYYISYEDFYIESGVVGIIRAENVDYDKIYQYDILGESSCVTAKGIKVLYGANVFEKSKSTEEEIYEIGISSPLEQNIELYINSEDGELSETKLKKVEIKNNQIITGYTTIKLKEPVKVVGDKFVIAIKYMPIDGDAYMGVETPSTTYWMTATSNLDESFYSLDGKTWDDMYNQYENTNICIKAFARTTKNNIWSNTYKIEDDIIYKIPQGTTFLEFKNNIETNGKVKILVNGQELSDNNILKTKAVVNIDGENRYRIAVNGDLIGTGESTVTSLSKVSWHLLEIRELNDIEKKAADINRSGDITITDYVLMLKALMWLINI